MDAIHRQPRFTCVMGPRLALPPHAQLRLVDDAALARRLSAALAALDEGAQVDARGAGAGALHQATADQIQGRSPKARRGDNEALSRAWGQPARRVFADARAVAIPHCG